jgi:RNA polymerase sigma-70 factor (ECF subfamily)
MLAESLPVAHGVDEAVADAAADADLVRVAQTDARAFAALYLRYRDRVLRYCAHRLGDGPEAEDAASAVFLKALRGLVGFRDRDGSFRSWHFVIAHNEVADRRSHRTRHPEARLDAAGRAAADWLPEERAAAADDYRRVRLLLAALPPRERAVLELRAAELETAEIARVLGITAQNVRTAQCRAVARLRAVFAAEDAPDREARDG